MKGLSLVGGLHRQSLNAAFIAAIKPYIIVLFPFLLFTPSGTYAQVREIYWADLVLNTIKRANLDGSEVEELIVDSLANPYDIALDVEGGKMYWTNHSGESPARLTLLISGNAVIGYV